MRTKQRSAHRNALRARLKGRAMLNSCGLWRIPWLDLYARAYAAMFAGPQK